MYDRSRLCRYFTLAAVTVPSVLAFGTRAHAERRPEGSGTAPAAASSAAPASAAPTRGTGARSAPTASAPNAATLPPDLAADPMLTPVAPAARVVATWRDALALVRARSPDYRVALSNVAQAEGQARVALAAVLPTLLGSANISYQAARTNVNQLTGTTTVETFPGHATTYAQSLQLTLPILAPRAWYGIGTANSGIELSKLQLANVKRQLAAAMASALVTLVTDERISELNRVALRTALERQALTRRRAELGAATGLDILRTEQDANSTRAAIVSGDETLRQARETLGLALGYAEPVGTPRELDLDAFARDSVAACPTRGGIEARPDVAAAAASARLARRSVHDVELQFLPSVSAVSTYAHVTQPFVSPGVPQQGIPGVDTNITLNNWSIAGVLSWTIFDGGVRYGNLRIARSNVDQADAQAEGVRRNATVEVARATRGVDVAASALGVAQVTRDQARETDRLARLNFELGRGTSLDLVDAARQLRLSEIQLAVQEFNVVQAKIAALLAISTCDY